MRRDTHKVVCERAKADWTWASETPRPNAVRIDSAGDQVYSEICAANHSRSRLQSEVREYVDHVLACGCKEVYVQPRTGILTRRREHR